jgi:membrane protease YdiL (CAAX protease family)
VFGAVVVIPICEELAFRGWLLRWLIARDFTRVSMKAWTPLALVGSSLAFGALHHRWIGSP